MERSSATAACSLSRRTLLSRSTTARAGASRLSPCRTCSKRAPCSATWPPVPRLMKSTSAPLVSLVASTA
eukprot:scaffold131032_cov40-Phaeocystis_antarctica.AAC.5